MDKIKCKGWKWHVVVEQGLVFLLIFLMGFLVVGSFSGLLTAQTGQNSVNLTLVSLFDMYGVPSINEDGTFYPNDRFEITYRTDLTREVNFETIEIHYDRSVFNMFSNSSAFGVEEVGGGSFEVLSSAVAGVYFFVVEVWGNRFTTSDSETQHYVLAEATLTVRVVEYDPHFVVALSYTVPTGNGSSSYEKPFALIVRYDGNGPDHNLGQRAILDDYVWEGYAQKMPDIAQMQQALIPNLTVASFLNQSTNTQFLTQGLTDEANDSQIVLRVDGQSFTNNELPLVFFWETNTNHTYIWTQTLSAVDGLSYEWFEWQASLTFPPAINPNLAYLTVSQEDLQNQILDQINSPKGTLTPTPFGNTITAMYSHNKDIEQIAKNIGVDKNQTLHTLNKTPQYFTLQERYAKLQYQLDPKVAKELINQNFTTLYYNLTLGCNLFGTPRYFEANFTCEHEYFNKPINTTAYKWNPIQQNWTTDNTVNIEATFECALNTTTTDILRSNLEEQTNDPIALKMTLDDLYDSGPQTFKGTGTIEANLKHASPLYYNLKITATGQQQKVTLQKTLQINFQNNNTYHLPLNFDPNSPLQVTALSDSSQNTLLNLDAPAELGGMANITVDLRLYCCFSGKSEVLLAYKRFILILGYLHAKLRHIIQTSRAF